jgi:hypothetical protein
MPDAASGSPEAHAVTTIGAPADPGAILGPRTGR